MPSSSKDQESTHAITKFRSGKVLADPCEKMGEDKIEEKSGGDEDAGNLRGREPNPNNYNSLIPFPKALKRPKQPPQSNKLIETLRKQQSPSH